MRLYSPLGDFSAKFVALSKQKPRKMKEKAVKKSKKDVAESEVYFFKDKNYNKNNQTSFKRTIFIHFLCESL